MWLVRQRTCNFNQVLVLVLAFKSMYCQFFCYFGLSVIKMALSNNKRNEIASLTTRNFNNSWLSYVTFSDTTNLCRNIWLIENWKCELFLYLKQNVPKRTNLNFLKGCFSVMGGAMDMIFGAFLVTYEKIRKSITSQFFSRYS